MSEVHPFRSSAGCQVGLWWVQRTWYSSWLFFVRESRILSNCHSSISSPSSSRERTSPSFLLECSLLISSCPAIPV